jgi:hypothetical protein
MLMVHEGSCDLMRHRIVHIRLAAGHVLHMLGIGQDQLKVAPTQDVPDWSPIHPSRLHPHMRAAAIRQPRPQGQKSCRRRLERAGLLLNYRPSVIRTQATIVFLCISRPPTRG